MPVAAGLSSLDPATAPEVLALVRRCPDVQPFRYPDGECLVTEGAEDRDIFLVVQGGLRVERTGDPPQSPPKILATQTCEPGHPAILGEMAYFGAQRRTATVRSVGASLALRLQPKHLDEIFEHLPGLTQLLCRQFTQRLQETNDALLALQRRFEMGPARRMAEAGERLFSRGDPPQALHQLLMGAIELETSSGVRIVGPQDLPEGFLEPESFLRNQPHASSATVSGTAFLLAIGPDRKEAFLRSYPQVALRILEAAPPPPGNSLSPQDGR